MRFGENISIGRRRNIAAGIFAASTAAAPLLASKGKISIVLLLRLPLLLWARKKHDDLRSK